MQTKKLQKLLIGVMLLIMAVMLISCKTLKIEDKAEADTAGTNTAETGTAESSKDDSIDVRKMLEDEIKKRSDLLAGMAVRAASAGECIDVNIDVIEKDGSEELCLDKSTLVVGIVNEGDAAISGFDLVIESSKSGEIPTRISSQASPGDEAASFLSYDADKYGRIEKLAIVPLITLNGKKSACKGKSITRKNIGMCS